MPVSLPNLSNLVNFMKKLPGIYNDFDDQFMYREAVLLQRTVRDHIDKQDLKWQPLSDAYFNYKKREGLEVGKWAATTTLYDQIQVHRAAPGVYHVGGRRGELYERPQMVDGQEVYLLEVNQLIQIHEYGLLSRNIPARPLFIPSQMELYRSRPGRYAKFMRFYYKYYLKKLL